MHGFLNPAYFQNFSSVDSDKCSKLFSGWFLLTAVRNRFTYSGESALLLIVDKAVSH